MQTKEDGVATPMRQGSYEEAFNSDHLPSTGLNQGAVAIETSRAVAEAQGALAIAKRFPRNVKGAMDDIKVICQQQSMAEKAFYSFPRGRETISGPSIRLAEQIALCWGNIEFGHRELSRGADFSEVEVFAKDLQSNTRSSTSFTVKHIIDLSGGNSRPAKSERDIDELIANKAGRRLRGRIMAILPKWLQEQAVETCRKTLAGGVTIDQRIERALGVLAKFGITRAMLEIRSQKPMQTFNDDDFADLQGMFHSLRDGMTTLEEWFDDNNKAVDTAKGAAINNSVGAAAGAQAGATAPAAGATRKGRQGGEPAPAANAAQQQAPAPQQAAQQQPAATATDAKPEQAATGQAAESHAANAQPLARQVVTDAAEAATNKQQTEQKLAPAPKQAPTQQETPEDDGSLF